MDSRQLHPAMNNDGLENEWMGNGLVFGHRHHFASGWQPPRHTKLDSSIILHLSQAV